MKRLVLAGLLLVAVPRALHAQDSTVTQAIRAYDAMDYDVAVTLLRRALATPLDDSTRVQALIYLGAAEHYRGREDSATAAFRRLATFAPRYQPDALIFAPEITSAYNATRAPLEQVVQVPSHAGGEQATRPDTAPSTVAVATRPPRPEHRAQTRTQLDRSITVTGAALLSNVHARSSGGMPSASGAAVGMRASARFRRFELSVRYREGSLGTRDLVEGGAALRFTTTSWLTLSAGPQIRRYDSPFGAERWATWQLGAGADAPLYGEHIRGHATFWKGVGLTVNVPPGSGSANGGEFGVTYDGYAPFWFALGYAIDQASVTSSRRRETVAALTIAAGLRRH